MEQKLERLQRAVLYIRVADPHAHDSAAEHQRDGCLRIANQYGLTVVREYIDYGCPARLNQQHELQRLLADLAIWRDVAFVVVWDYARLGDDLSQLDNITVRIRAGGAEIATMTGMRAAQRYIDENDGDSH